MPIFQFSIHLNPIFCYHCYLAIPSWICQHILAIATLQSDCFQLFFSECTKKNKRPKSPSVECTKSVYKVSVSQLKKLKKVWLGNVGSLEFSTLWWHDSHHFHPVPSTSHLWMDANSWIAQDSLRSSCGDGDEFLRRRTLGSLGTILWSDTMWHHVTPWMALDGLGEWNWMSIARYSEYSCWRRSIQGFQSAFSSASPSSPATTYLKASVHQELCILLRKPEGFAWSSTTGLGHRNIPPDQDQPGSTRINRADQDQPGLKFQLTSNRAAAPPSHSLQSAAQGSSWPCVDPGKWRLSSWQTLQSATISYKMLQDGSQVDSLDSLFHVSNLTASISHHFPLLGTRQVLGPQVRTCQNIHSRLWGSDMFRYVLRWVYWVVPAHAAGKRLRPPWEGRFELELPTKREKTYWEIRTAMHACTVLFWWQLKLKLQRTTCSCQDPCCCAHVFVQGKLPQDSMQRGCGRNGVWSSTLSAELPRPIGRSTQASHLIHLETEVDWSGHQNLMSARNGNR